MQKTLDNQRSGLDACARTLALADRSRVLLEFADEEHLFSLADVREWAERYAAGVGWNLKRCGDSRADARMMLFGPDGLQCWGGACPVRGRD